MLSVGLKSGSLVARSLALSAFRSAANKGLVPTHSTYKKVQQRQIEYLIDTGKMVWEKSGADRALFSGTAVTMAAIGGYSCYLIYYMIFPPQ